MEDFPHLRDSLKGSLAGLVETDVHLDAQLVDEYSQWKMDPKSFCPSVARQLGEEPEMYVKRLMQAAMQARADPVDRIRSRFLEVLLVDAQKRSQYPEAHKSNRKSFYDRLREQLGIGSLFLLPQKVPESV